MPTQLTWHEGWALGIEDLDADHREMLRLLNLLFTAGYTSDGIPATPAAGSLAPGADPLEVLARLDAVLKHLRAHFEREEAFLERIGYPQLEEHSGEHALENIRDKQPGDLSWVCNRFGQKQRRTHNFRRGIQLFYPSIIFNIKFCVLPRS